MRPSFIIVLFLGTTALAQTENTQGAPPPASTTAAPTAEPQDKPVSPPAPPAAAPEPAPRDRPPSTQASQPPAASPGAMKPAAPPEVRKPEAAAAKPGTPVLPPAREAPAAPGVARAPVPDEALVLARAKYAFASLLLGDPRPLVEQASFPFMLEDRRFNTPDELYEELTRQLRPKRTDLLTLYGIEVLSPADMEKKYGKPPARLSNFPIHTGGKVLLTVANLSGHGAVAAYRQVGTDWRMVGYHD